MKNITYLVAMLLSVSFFSCNTEEVLVEETSLDPNFRVFESNSSNLNARATVEDPCMTTNLIAGQHHIAGTVSVNTEGNDLVITYTTNSDWTIGATHMSIGNCDEQWVPTTGSDNPKIGKFEHSTEHSDGVTEVTYYIDMSVLDNEYCFAAHAEVSGSTGGETAWAEGAEFDGKNWAMYVEALLSDCDLDGSDDPVK